MRVGIVGSGFMAKGLTMALGDMVDSVLTRTTSAERTDFPIQHLLTCNPYEMLESSDLIIECCGDVVYATDMVVKALEFGLPVITLDPALHITSGSYLNTLGWFSEAEGDQPGCLAALAEDLTTCGFTPLIYGNIKGYQNLNPKPHHMEAWAKHLGISTREVVANTDGTKLQIEQCLVANWFRTNIIREGMVGLPCKTLDGGVKALDSYAKICYPITDYVIPMEAAPGVFILANHPDSYQHSYLKYLKLGSGPYLFSTNYHLCHLEVIKTIRRWERSESVLMNNGVGTPSFSVAAIAKRTIRTSETIGGIGSFDVRGSMVRIEEHPHHVPIGLLQGAKAKRAVAEGSILTFDDVLLPDSLALRAWCEYHA